MKRMLIASSALALMAAPSFAQDSAYDPATQQPGASDERGDQRNGLHDGWSDDDHPLSGVAVYTNDGERVGSVERVRGGAGADAHAALADGASEDLDVTGLVIETGGFLGIGTRELDIELGQAQRTSVEGDERIILDMSNAEFELVREYARDDDDGDTSMRTGMSYSDTMDSRDAYRDDHPLKAVAVYTRDGEQVGSVERVRGGAQAGSYTDLADGDTADLDVSGLVVETGGFLGIGTREVNISAGQAQRTSVDGERRIILDMSNAEFERMREYAREEDDRRDRDADAWDGDTSAGMTQRTTGDAYRTDTRTGSQAGMQGQAGATGATRDAFRDDHPLKDVAVYTRDGDQVGSVERVRGGALTGSYADLSDGATAELDVSGLVVETGGFLGIGTREVDISAGRAHRTSVDGEHRVVLDMTNAEFERMREHARDDDAYSSASQTDARSQAATENRTARETQQARAETDARANSSGEVHGDVYTDAHHWVGTPVYSSNGERLGAVHQVRAFSDTAYAGGGDTVAMMEANPDVNAIVVRTGGVLGMGQRNVQIGIDRVELEMVDGDARLVFDGNAEAFREMPNHDDRATRRASNR
jgi:sporulation protein YlmC with PRC-barrel domain